MSAVVIVARSEVSNILRRHEGLLAALWDGRQPTIFYAGGMLGCIPPIWLGGGMTPFIFVCDVGA